MFETQYTYVFKDAIKNISVRNNKKKLLIDKKISFIMIIKLSGIFQEMQTGLNIPFMILYLSSWGDYRVCVIDK